MYSNLQEKRNKALVEAYEQLISSKCVNTSYLTQSTILKIMSEIPAPRFYITPHVAQLHVHLYRAGVYNVVSPIKARMIEELNEVYERICKENKGLSKWCIWELVVMEQASSFFMSERNMKEVLFNYKGR